MIKYLKNLFTSILLWFKLPKIGRINIDVQESTLRQDVRADQQRLDVDLEEWEETFNSVFESDNFVVEGFERPKKPNDEILKQQIQLFWKDYRKLNQKVDQLYTKTVNFKNDDGIDDY